MPSFSVRCLVQTLRTNPTTFFAVVVLQEREEEELPARHGQCHQCGREGGGGAVFFPGSSLFFLRCFCCGVRRNVGGWVGAECQRESVDGRCVHAPLGAGA